jgi:hypothetical protein
MGRRRIKKVNKKGKMELEQILSQLDNFEECEVPLNEVTVEDIVEVDNE